MWKNKDYHREYYLKNRETIIKRVMQRLKETNYASEKTSKARQLRYIKRRTRQIYPLAFHFCEFCGEKATEHHHNTFPIEIDKFNYVCHKCHNIIQKEVKQANDKSKGRSRELQST